MFNKHEFKLETFVAASWIYGKLCISIVGSTVPLIDPSAVGGVKVSSLTLPYTWTTSFVVEIFSGLKSSNCLPQYMVIYKHVQNQTIQVIKLKF